MTREEAHTLLEVMAIELTGELADIECPVTERTKLLGKQLEAIDMAIEALSADAVQGERGHMMIDGNKLMLALSEWWYSSFGLEETEESKAIHKVMDEVERYVDHEKSADYWIPCSERLPSEDGFYIATCDGEICGEDQPFTGFAEFENRKWVDDEDDYQCVLAWMPLPKPWKGADDE